MSQSKWLIKPHPKPNADLRIICFPYAGGSASTYISWSKLLPNNVELIAVQPPGRSSRMFEPCFTEMSMLVNDFLRIMPSIIDKPYILIGHSLGSRVAFELMLQCQRQGIQTPVHFIASGSRGPHIKPRKKPIHHLPEKEFILELEELNGTPMEILKNKELITLCLPLLRADFQLAENYLFTSDVSFECRVTVFGGQSDSEITITDLSSWEIFFTGLAETKLFAGDHFFIESNKRDVIKEVNTIIQLELVKLASKHTMVKA